MLTELANKAKMYAWAATVDRIVSKPPGSDEGFSAESIERNSTVSFAKFTTWTIICEEMLDTQFPRRYFEEAREELHRRGITDAEIAEMRRFAWLTAGCCYFWVSTATDPIAPFNPCNPCNPWTPPRRTYLISRKPWGGIQLVFACLSPDSLIDEQH